MEFDTSFIAAVIFMSSIAPVMLALTTYTFIRHRAVIRSLLTNVRDMSVLGYLITLTLVCSTQYFLSIAVIVLALSLSMNTTIQPNAWPLIAISFLFGTCAAFASFVEAEMRNRSSS